MLSAEPYQSGRHEMIVAAVTSNLSRMLSGDYRIKDWEASGLPLPSIVTGILRTIKQNMVVRTIGTLPSPERKAFEKNLKLMLSL